MRAAETHPWFPLYKPPYPVGHLCHAFPVLRPARALASRFPLGSVLCSIGSAGTDVPLFADFTANMTESDFSMPSIIGYGLCLSFAIPPRQRHGMETSQIPVQCVRTCMGSSTPRDSDPPRHTGESNAAFGAGKSLGIPDHVDFDAQ